MSVSNTDEACLTVILVNSHVDSLSHTLNFHLGFNAVR